MIVSDFVENINENIPMGFYDILPKECDEQGCNSPMVMTELLTELQCSNPFCPSKVSYRIHQLLEDIGVTYITESQVHEFVIDHKITNVFEIFLYDFSQEPVFSTGVSDILSKALSSTLKQNKLFTNYEYVKVAHLPNMSLMVKPLFKDCSDLNVFYEKLESKGLAYLQLLLKEDSNTITVDMVKVYETLLTYKNELLEGLNYVNIL
jgi:hypothetical protein